MSLIALRARLQTGRSTARRLLLLIALTGAVIVGLLAMHSLSGHAASGAGDHAADTAVVADRDIGHAHSATTATTATTVVTDVCADCGDDHSSMLAMACVLALLAVALLLRPQPGHRWLSTMPRPRPVPSAPASRTRRRPPSLTALCISRT
ncbi:DUF6153 family protein [Microbacterium cremeum]|uniref:DUF6153 family protein n=1 Tax=Microbacterium cremeum TaxID=2782169 RepID=UPI0018892C81|nr:DUF6153 family protein [Microbacterium cremeum]